MNMYWLTRNGSDSEGPFTLAQLKRMFDGGDVTAMAQVCLDGTENWVPLLDELEHGRQMQRSFAAPPPPPRIVEGQLKRGSKAGGVGCFLLIVAIGMLCFIPIVGIAIGVVALVVDHMSLFYHCSICGNEVAKSSRHCPHCKATLTKPWWKLY